MTDDELIAEYRKLLREADSQQERARAAYIDGIAARLAVEGSSKNPVVVAIEAVRRQVALGNVASVTFDTDDLPPMDEMAHAAHLQFWLDD